MADAPRLTIPELRGYISDASELVKGTQIADSGAILNPARHENRIFGETKGSGATPYRVSLTFGEKTGELKARCSCMAARSRPFCKHSAALLVAWARAPESFVVSDAPPVSDAPARKAKNIKTGKAEGADLMKHGVERVLTLVRELAVAGIAVAGLDRVEQVRQLGESLRENRLRRLSARTLELSAIIRGATTTRGHVDAVAYADLVSDLLLTGRKLERHLAGEPLDDRYVEELIGKTWRAADRKPTTGLDLVEYAFLTSVTADNFVIRESRFVDCRAARTIARNRSCQLRWHAAPSRSAAMPTGYCRPRRVASTQAFRRIASISARRPNQNRSSPHTSGVSSSVPTPVWPRHLRRSRSIAATCSRQRRIP